MTNTDLLKMEPLELEELLYNQYSCELPTLLETSEDLIRAGELMAHLTNAHSYLVHLGSIAKIMVRTIKRDKTNPKELVDDAIDRRDIILAMCSSIELQIKMLSRLGAFKQEINKEINMVYGAL